MGFPSSVFAQGIKDWKSSGCISPEGIPTLKCFEIVFSNILFAVSSLIIVVLLIMLIMGGFRYLTSFGNPEKVKKAQSTLKYAIIGFIVFISAVLILRTIDILFLGGTGTLLEFRLGE